MTIKAENVSLAEAEDNLKININSVIGNCGSGCIGF